MICPRGFHSHRKTKQIIFPLCGSFKIELTDGFTTETYFLEQDNIGLYIPLNIWLKMFDYSKDCMICFLCSYRYDESEYVRNYGDFLKLREINSISVVKNFDLKKQTSEIKSSILLKINNILDKNNYVMGHELDEFEKNFALYNNVKYCVGLSNGTAAIVAALKALQLKEDDEIIVQSNTYIAAPLAIEMAGLKIKIVDIDENLNIDLVELEKNITEKTKAIIVVHLYGMCPDMDKLLEIKNKYGIHLIEDAAQAHDSTYKGIKLGTFGDIGCFSFYPSKNLGSIGEDGCIVTDNYIYSDYIRRYRNYGSIEKYKWELKGSNERMHTIQAAVLDIKLPYLDKWNQMRNNLANIYDEELKNIAEIKILNNHKELYRNYHLYVILVENRDVLNKYLKENGIMCAIHYPDTFYKSSAFQELNSFEFRADEYKNKLLSLPMYPELSVDDVKIVCHSIKNFYNKIINDY